MNIDPPHRITENIDEVPPEDRHRWIPLTDEEHALLEDKSPEERSHWIDENVGSGERLARHLEQEGAPGWLIVRARRGEYSDYSSPFSMPEVQLIKECKALSPPLYRTIRMVKEGKFDATPRESDEWAAAQTGEVGDLLDKLDLRRQRRPNAPSSSKVLGEEEEAEPDA